LNMKRCFCCSALAMALILSLGVTRTSAQSSSAATTSFDLKAEVLSDLQGMRTKYVGLAQATPAEKYTWRPGDGVRSVSEVFLHVALMNFVFTPMAGATPPQGFTREKYEMSTTDKSKVVDQLNQSFDYSQAAIEKMSDADIQKHVKMFGKDSTSAAVLVFMANDLHEHLGQMIAYARMNNIVPPWTAAAAAAKQGGGQRPPE
jgi:uncharacterized damage-inducible protein DinB